MKTLLEQAKEHAPIKKGIEVKTEEEIELVLAWLKGELINRQVTQVVTYARTNLYTFLATTLRQAYEEGKLIIKL